MKRFGGYLVIDDTQALGILGHNPVQHKPYGLGGGGSLRWHDIQNTHIISVSSLANGFGVPLAILSGSNKFVRRFEAESDTRVHSSQAFIADIHAAEHALKISHADAVRGADGRVYGKARLLSGATGELLDVLGEGLGAKLDALDHGQVWEQLTRQFIDRHPVA